MRRETGDGRIAISEKMEYFKKAIASFLALLIISTPVFYLFEASEYGYLSWQTLLESLKFTLPFSFLLGLLMPYFQERYRKNEGKYRETMNKIKERS
jgi:hypothetical protein